MYLRLDEGAPTHRKTLAMCRILGNQEALMFMIRLWTWACRSSPRGDLTGAEPGDIEEIARWRGTPGVFYAAAVGVGFIEELPGGVRVLHDWDDWTGGDIEEMAAEARRKWWFRRHSASPRKCGGAAGLPEPCPICSREGGQSSGGPSADGRRTSTVDKTRPGKTRPGKTRPGKTRPDQKEKTPPNPRKRGNGRVESPEFQEWFAAYPRKVARDDAWKAWQQTEQSRADLGSLLATLKWQRELDFDRRPPDKVPYPATYLRSGQWKDEKPQQTAKPRPGAAPSNPLEAYCPWHREAINDDKPSRHPKPSCPRCKHLAAASRTRRPSEPTAIGALADEMPGWAK